MKKKICEIERSILRCASLECFRPCQKRQKHKFSGNKFCVQARRLEQTIGRLIAGAARRNGASGASDMHGNAARVAESEPGGERMNLSRSVAIRCASLKRPPRADEADNLMFLLALVAAVFA
jgi:hypothetical protein